MRKATPWILAVLLVAGGAGFYWWKKLRKHDIVMAVSASGCRGEVEVEEVGYRDGKQVVKGGKRIAPDAGGKVAWTSQEHHYPAGTQFSVLARGGCQALACRILLDGDEGIAGTGQEGQVSCTAMVGD